MGPPRCRFPVSILEESDHALPNGALELSYALTPALRKISARWLRRCARSLSSSRSFALSPKIVEEQKQILRLTTPELKDVRGPVRSE